LQDINSYQFPHKVNKMSNNHRHSVTPIPLTGVFEDARPENPSSPYIVGVLSGEGIGPDIISISLSLLKVIEQLRPVCFDLRWGGKIGKEAIAESGNALSSEVISFCRQLFNDGGALFCGPGGERFVYNLRLEFDLYCKLAPIQPMPALIGVGALKPSAMENVDILVVRENTGGLYQGQYGFDGEDGKRRAWQNFHYSEQQVTRILNTAAKLAARRKGSLCAVTKPGGAPSISRLWEERAISESATHGVSLRVLEVDNACYQIIADARHFDVVVAPNLFGDIIADNAALLLASRGMSYSANFSASGHAVYQTGHGAAHDLYGTDRANPIGQILSLSMMLEQSFGLNEIATEIRQSVNDTLAAGWRTPDIASAGCHVIGSKAMGEMIATRLGERLSNQRQRSLVTLV
jgi:3-isopropylmalate dehydrogenase